MLVFDKIIIENVNIKASLKLLPLSSPVLNK